MSCAKSTGSGKRKESIDGSKFFESEATGEHFLLPVWLEAAGRNSTDVYLLKADRAHKQRSPGDHPDREPINRKVLWAIGASMCSLRLRARPYHLRFCAGVQ